MRLPNRFFFVGLLVGIAIAAGAMLAFPHPALQIVAYAFDLRWGKGTPNDALAIPQFPEDPTVGLLNQRLQRLNGSETSLSEFQEKILFVNFWASWCAPCVEEMPAIERLAEHFHDADVAFLLISEESTDTVRGFVEEHGLAVPVYTMSESRGSLSLGAVPTTFILDETRQVVFSRIGAAQWDDESSIVFLNNLLKDGSSEIALPAQRDGLWGAASGTPPADEPSSLP